MIEEHEDQDNGIKILCPACQGSGLSIDAQGESECTECHGRGMYMFFSGRFLYWGRPFTTAAIFRARLRRFFEMIVKATLIFIGVLGLVYVLLELIFLVPDGVSLEKFLELKNPRMLIFWISIAVDMIIVYYFDVELAGKRSIDYVPPKNLPPIPKKPKFSDFARMPEKFKLDISTHFTEESIRAFERSWYVAREWGHGEVLPIHLFAAIIGTSEVRRMFARFGIAGRDVYARLRTVFSKLPRVKHPHLKLSAQSLEVLFESYVMSYNAKRRRVSGAEVMRNIARQKGPVRDVFEDLDLSEQKVDNVAAWIYASDVLRRQYHEYRAKASLKPKGIMNRALTARPTPLLDSVSTDLTLQARGAGFFPLVNRTKEMAELLRTLEQSGGNILLVGEVGVGKRAIVHGLAERMVVEDVPQALQDKRLVALNASVLLSLATQNVEARLLQIVHEVSASGNIILFIEDIAQLVGAGGSGSQTLDASAVLTQALTSKGVRMIASASTQDFARHLQDNQSFLRHFHVIHVDEVESDIAIQILEAQSLYIEAKEKVMFSYDSIAAAVRLSDQYVHDEFLPQKAITIAEETAVYARESKGSPALVTKEDVEEVISRKTNIRVGEASGEEVGMLLNLEERIHERIVGQDEAVKIVSEAIRRARTKMRDEDRPIVNLLFLGPTGVGKTELAKTVADVYFGAETNMIRMDMSEYQEKTSLDRLIGSANTKGQLTEAVRNAPFSLVLFDELEKAHPDILNVFLQMMDDGRLTDGTGRTVDFTNAIIIATSNAGTQFIQDQVAADVPMEKIQDALIHEKLREFFRPEFLNRFDSIVVFEPLTKDEVVQITKLEIRKAAKRLEAKGIRLIATDEAVQELADKGYDPTLGARPIRRLIQEHLESSLAKFLLRGKIGRRDIAVLEPGGKIHVERAEQLG